MIDLRVLGALDLRAAGGSEILSVLAQPKRTALLCYLALASPRGFQRKDPLLALFWPEQDQEHARAALRQSIYFLRRSLGEETIVSRGDDELGIGEGALRCDALSFEAAVNEGRPDEALELYRGELLQGFFLEDAPEFERWLRGERERLRGRAAQAAWSMAERAEASRDAEAAASWGKKALALSPADETVARRLITLLERLGDRAAAIRTFEAFAWNLEQELGLRPSTETRALVETIRQRESAPPPQAMPQEPVTSAEPVPPATPAAPAATPPVPGPQVGPFVSGGFVGAPGAPTRRGRSWRDRIFGRLFHAFRAGSAPDRSVAVLPLANFSPNPGDAYLGDALSDEIIGSLAKIEGLRVAARTSSFVFRGGGVDVRDIGQHLNVGTVLEGSIQRVGNVLRVTTQLIDARDGFHLWSEHWNAEMDDVFRIEEEISANVARVLALLLRAAGPSQPQTPAIPRTNVPAYESYLRGRQYFLQTRRRSLHYAREMFEHAISADPGYALAHAALADAIALEAMYYPDTSADLPAAEAASLRALELAPELGEVHSAHANVLFMSGRHPEAEVEYREAIRRDPSLFEPRYFYARMCFQDGRLEEAVRLFQEACRVREDYQAPFFAAQTVEALGRKDLARDWYARALAAAETHMQLNPDDARACTTRAVALCRLGRREEGLAWGQSAVAADPEDAGVRYNVACLYAVAGETEHAIDLLEEAIRGGFGNREWLDRDPDLQSLRDDPRFRKLTAGPGAPR